MAPGRADVRGAEARLVEGREVDVALEVFAYSRQIDSRALL
eukprot:CAMPEP_0117541742 /NCGR_PEP_ID=MMETSP0784-20121206/44174_1 /TAXON_ID=39447 /ORGANISM="" /LENGTH=40 /DNA_ID= /DNA_START= /DNA_END= /DNA_ORIENTATION=